MAITEYEPLSEDELVTQWRIEELGRVGYTPEAALVIALDAGVDLHQAVDLLHRGCPHDVALRILL
jgi:hypothetical protein